MGRTRRSYRPSQMGSAAGFTGSPAVRSCSLACVCLLAAIAVSALAKGTYDPATDKWRLDQTSEGEPQTRSSWGSAVRDGWVFTPEVKVNDPTSGFHLWPDVAVGNADTVNAIWMDERSGRYRVYHSYSSDYGLTWSDDELVDDSPSGMCRFPSLAVDRAGLVYAVWEDTRAGDFDVYFSKRVASGTTFVWTPSLRINDAGSSPGGADYMNACITAGAPGHVYVAWTDWREGVYHQVYFSASADCGTTWTADTRISDKVGVDPVAGDPSLIVDPDDSLRLYCVFNDWREPHGPRYPEVYFSKSTDGGATWGANVRVNDISPYYQQVASRVVGVDGHDLMYVAWFNWDFVSLPEVRVSVSEDAGVSFGSSTRVNDDSTSEVGTYPSLTVDRAGGAFGVWMDSRDGHWNVYFSASSDTARTWLANVRVDTSEANTSDYNPVVTVDERRRVGIGWSYYPHGQDYQIVFSSGVEETLGVSSQPGTLPVSTGSSLSVAPNPSRGWCSVRYLTTRPARLLFCDSAGRVLESMEVEPGRRGVTLPLRGPVGQGVYFLLLHSDRTRISTKILLLK